MPDDLETLNWANWAEDPMSTNEDCVRTIESPQIALLVQMYLRQLIPEIGRYPVTYACEECVSWFGLKLVRAACENEKTNMITLTFRMEHELTHALSLPEHSELTTLMWDRTECYYIYSDDIPNATELRLSDRQKLIDEFSLQQLQKMKAYIETIMPILMMQKE